MFRKFFSNRLNWLILGAVVPVLGMLGFVIFQPVKVVPRLSYAPSYALSDENGDRVTDQSLLGEYKLYAVGYTSDPTGLIENNIDEIRHYLETVQSAYPQAEIRPVLLLFDSERDTAERRRTFAAEHDLNPEQWLLLGGDEDMLKKTIGLGFGIYYEAIPIEELPEEDVIRPDAAGDYAYLQANSYFLVDGANIIRAEYRPPIDMEIAMRDMELLMREESATGAAKAVNEAAHFFLCYP